MVEMSMREHYEDESGAGAAQKNQHQSQRRYLLQVQQVETLQQCVWFLLMEQRLKNRQVENWGWHHLNR